MGRNWLLMLASPGDSEGDLQSMYLQVLSFSRLRRSRQLSVSRVCCDGYRRRSCEGAGGSARKGDTHDKSSVLLFTNAYQQCHCPRADSSHIASSLICIPHPEGEEVCSRLGHYVFIRQLQNFLLPGFLQRSGHLTACGGGGVDLDWPLFIWHKGSCLSVLEPGWIIGLVGGLVYLESSHPPVSFSSLNMESLEESVTKSQAAAGCCLICLWS